jgi:hypothetical protein
MPQNNPDRNFSTEINRTMEPPDRSLQNDLDDLFDDPVIRRRVAKLIALAMRKNLAPVQ